MLGKGLDPIQNEHSTRIARDRPKIALQPAVIKPIIYGARCVGCDKPPAADYPRDPGARDHRDENVRMMSSSVGRNPDSVSPTATCAVRAHRNFVYIKAGPA